METSSIKASSKSWKQSELSINTPFEEIDRLYKLQQTNRQNVKNTKPNERLKKLKRLLKALMDNRDIIQQALQNDLRRPFPETDLVEIYPVKGEINHAIAHLAEWMQTEFVDTPLAHFGSSSEVIYEPKGVTLNISPWNYPFQLALIPVVSCVAAGCTMLIKPSEFTPYTNVAIRKVISEVFNENEIAVVEGDHSVSQYLLKMKWDHIYFTGSPAIGKVVMRAAAEHLTSVTLELGGKSPAILDATANVNEAAKKIAWGKFINTGQTCIAPDYVLVHSSKQQAFIDAFKLQIEKFYGKDVQASADLTRIINTKHFDRIKGLVEDAVAGGAKILCGGEMDEADLFIAPTLIGNVSPDSKLMDEEIFGPVLPIVVFNENEEVVRLINSKEKPLAMYIFSKKHKYQDYFIQNTSSGGTCINDTLLQNGQVNLPFGGVNNSGLGKGHGKWGFLEFSNPRAIYKQHLTNSAAQGMYPPYNNTKKKLINFTLKWL